MKPSCCWIASRIAVAPASAHVEVRGLPLSVRDREHLVGHEEPERVERERDADRDRDDDVEGVVDREIEPRDDEHADRDGRDHLGDLTRAPGNDHRVDDPDGDDRHHRDRRRREREPPPPSDHGDAERARAGDPCVDRDAQQLEGEHAADEGEQVPPPPEHHQRDEQADREHGDAPAGREPVDAIEHVGQPVGPQSGDPAQDRGIDPIGQPLRPVGLLHDDDPRGQDADRDQPALAADPDAAWQRRRRARRSALPVPATDRRRDLRLRCCRGRRTHLRGHASFS